MIKNYTSSVPIERTVARIEELLAKAGASGIQKDYKDGQLDALCFKIDLPQRHLVVRLPANHQGVYDTLLKQVRRPNRATHRRIAEQSGRTSWKLMQDWVEVQLSLIAMQQADFMQVFLPYVFDGQQTFYQRLKAGNFLALPEHTG